MGHGFQSYVTLPKGRYLDQMVSGGKSKRERERVMLSESFSITI